MHTHLLLALTIIVLVAGCTQIGQTNSLVSIYMGDEHFDRYELPQTLGECETSADCSVQGCGFETCTNKEERIIGVCDNLSVQSDTVCTCVNSLCQWVSKETYGCPTPCPFVAPPHPDYCLDGDLVPTDPDNCGCEQMLTCVPK
ncbi:MAG: hypothetical protein KKA90_04235 [Nanoarchaeota archaeon]|nr:hypothetical protein [Nanoarchaeota archaeon]